MDMTSCLAVSGSISNSDRDDLLAHLDMLIESGVPPQEAQHIAASDALAEIEQEREDMIALLKEQHPDVFTEAKTEEAVVQPAEAKEPPAKKRSTSRYTASAGRIRMTVAKMVEAAKSQESWRTWYEQHLDTLKEMFGDDAPLFSRILAVTSQASTVASNVSLAVKAYRQFHSGEPFTGYIAGVRNNLERLRTGEVVKGSKISQYDRATSGDGEGMAVDRHIAELMFNTKKPNLGQIRAAQRRMRHVAETLGWTPREVQSALWAFNQVRKGKNPEEVQSYDGLLKRHSRAFDGPKLLAADAGGRGESTRGTSFSSGVGNRLQPLLDETRRGDGRGRQDAGIEAAGVDLIGDSSLRFSARQTKTPEFKKWFGDSKVVDDAGKPLVVYHGTGASFTVFKPSKNGNYGPGIYLTSDRDDADGFGPEDGKTKIISAYLSLQNPAYSDDYYRVAKKFLKSGSFDKVKTRAELERLGYDGIIIDEDEGDPVEYVAFRPEQIKSATKNDGSFDANDQSILSSARTGRFTLREFGRTAEAIEAIQDRYNRWKQAIEDIRKQGGTISEDNDFYRAEERYWSKVGSQMEDFQREVEAWVKQVSDDGLTMDAVARYAYARHAEERNEWIADKRPTMPDGGSGMTTAEAANELLTAQQSGLEPLLTSHADKLKEWSEETRDLMLREGLITQDEYDAWNLQFQNYVPLRGLPEDSDLEGVQQGRGLGQGFNIRGKESKEAKGRRSEAKQIIENIIADRTKTYVRSGKNEVGRHFLKFVLDNPSPNLWEIEAVENKPISTVDANGDRVIEERPTIISDNRAITVKDGGREIHITVRDQRLRDQLQNMHVENIGAGIGALLFVNRILSRLYTSLSPTFPVINFVRDVTTAGFGAIEELGFMGAARVYANLPKSIYESYLAEAGNFTPDYDAYRKSGGKTGFYDHRTIDDLTKELTDLSSQAERNLLDPRKLGPKTLKVIEALNAGVENAVRLASFKAARESGKTVAEAAHISKNLTVNFNRKGTLTPNLAAWFLFFNPAVQGTTRMLQALKSPKVLATLGAAMTGMFALAMRNGGAGEDEDGVAWWDKIPDEVKERNIIIVLQPGSTTGDAVPGSKMGRYLKIPMPYGYNVFGVMANQAADLWRNSLDPRRGRDAGPAFARVASAFLGSWIPVAEAGTALEGNWKMLAMVGTPDAFNPVMQNVLNTNPFGRPLMPDGEQTKNLPNYDKVFAGQVGTVFQKAAEGLNTATGGNEVNPGLIDLSPGQVENLVRGYMGGPATFTLDILNSIYARQSLARETMDLRRLPYAKQVYGVINEETDRMTSYANMDKAQVLVDRLKKAKGLTGETQDEVIAELEEHGGPILALGAKLIETRKQLSKMRKEELAILNGDGSDAKKLNDMLLLNRERRLLLQQFNGLFGEALVEQRRQKAAQP